VKGVFERYLEHAPAGTAAVLELASYVFAFALLGLSMLVLSGGGYNPFIYFRF
jgi:hypothetical protein